MQLLPRRPDGGFAAYYFCSKAELQKWGLAERAWEHRLPQRDAAPAFPDAEARRRAALEAAQGADPPASERPEEEPAE